MREGGGGGWYVAGLEGKKQSGVVGFRMSRG